MINRDFIASRRLTLVPFDVRTIEALLEDDHENVERALGVRVPRAWPRDFPGDRHLLEMRRQQLREQPGIERWLLRALVDADSTMVGHAGFHYPPAPVSEALSDPNYTGERADARGGLTEIGYTIFPQYRGRGLATEAADALIDWAFETMGLGAVIACTAPGNLASIRVLERVGGFRRIGRALDEDGDEEIVYRRDRAIAVEP